MNEFKEKVSEYLANNNQRIILQRFYLLSFIAVVSTALLVNLFDRNLGYKLIFLAFFLLSIYLINATTWVIGNALKTNFLPVKRPNKDKKK